MIYLKTIAAISGIFALSSPAIAQLTKEEKLKQIMADIRADPAALEKVWLALGRDGRQPPVRSRAVTTPVSVAPTPKVDEVAPPPRPVTLLNKNTPAVRDYYLSQRGAPA